jgi:hypothetical protein
MIIRILGEGQYTVDDSRTEELNTLDVALLQAVDTGDPAAFRPALGALLTAVEDLGSPLPDTALLPSDLVLPARAANLDEVEALLRDDGLIPG